MLSVYISLVMADYKKSKDFRDIDDQPQLLHRTRPTSMTSKILFLIGSGANIGAATVRTFLAAGWKVAQASRSAKAEESTSENLRLFIDLAKPETVTEAFKEVRAKLGEPNAVIYNGT